MIYYLVLSMLCIGSTVIFMECFFWVPSKRLRIEVETCNRQTRIDRVIYGNAYMEIIRGKILRKRIVGIRRLDPTTMRRG